MNEVMTACGGMATEDDFVGQCHAIMVSEGSESTLASAKNNLMSKGNLSKAGLVKVSIDGKTYVYDRARLEVLMDNRPVQTHTNITRPTAPVPTTPEGGTFYGVPRAPDFVHEDEATQAYVRSLVRPAIGFVEGDQREFRLIAMCDKRGKHVMLRGPTGSGKTALANDYCAHTNQPYIRVNCSEGLDEFALMGHFVQAADGTTKWVEGFLPIAMKHGLKLVMDEVNAVPEAVGVFLHGAMDFGQISIPWNDNEQVQAAPGFMVIGCINPPERYAGMKEMNTASLSRYRMVIDVDYAKFDKEVEILTQQSGVNNREAAQQLVRLGNDIRMTVENGEMETDLSTRNLIDALSFTEDMSLAEAVRLCIVSRFPADERPTVARIARARIPGYDEGA